MAKESIDFLDLSESESKQDIDIENDIIHIKELIKSVNELYQNAIKD